MHIRTINAYMIAPLLKVTGYRFGKDWRHGDTATKYFIYEYLLCTVKANTLAGLPPIDIKGL